MPIAHVYSIYTINNSMIKKYNVCVRTYIELYTEYYEFGL